MKKFVSFFLSLAFAGSTFAQMSGYSSSQSDGTTLGANETLTADGIALGNAVKLRGYVDFRLQRIDDEDNNNEGDDHTTVGTDLDFLIDLSPVTAELHLNLTETNGADLLEQAFGRYSFNQDFHLTFGRQSTVLGFDSDEANELYAVTRAYARGDAQVNPGKQYVDGIRFNYNNGMFGLILGLHDSYKFDPSNHALNNNSSDDLDNGIALDIAASVMFFPGLEASLGFENDNGEAYGSNDDIQQINTWLAWNPGDLTLAVEFDHIDKGDDEYAWDFMLLGNYQFSDFFGATLRYVHMDEEDSGADLESDRITLALLFTITEHFDLNLEYSHTDNDGGDDDNEFYLQGLISY